MSDNWYPSLDTGVVVINDTDIETSRVVDSINWDDPQLMQATKAMKAWYDATRSRGGGIFDRDKFVTPNTTFRQFDTARAAMDDDVVGGAYETTESLAFSKIGLETVDKDEQDVWNQIARDIDLDSRLREMWRDLFTYSQFYTAIYFGKKTYKVRGKTLKGNAKRKTFTNIRVPLGLTQLDPRKVLPVGNFMFNQERLIYLAEPYEAEMFDKALAGGSDDKIVSQLIVSEFDIGQIPNLQMYKNDIGWTTTSITKAYLLNPLNVFRHTLTRQQYRILADVRMKSVFELLDLKRQLKEMDRAHLLGATNFILLIKKGTEQHPASAPEMAALSNYVRLGSKVPIIVGDHRLNIEIITPKTDHVLDKNKYDLIDTRIQGRLFQMFVNPGGRQEDSLKLARVVARGMENRRHMMTRSIEKYIIRPTYEANSEFSEEANLVYRPKRIALDFDAQLATFLLDLRDRREISRESMLSEFDFDQEEEANKLQYEDEVYDDIFQSAVPFSAPIPPQTPVGPGKQPANNPARKKRMVSPADPGPAGAQAPTPVTIVDPKAAGRSGGGTRGGGGATKPSNKRGKSKDQQA